MPSPDVGPRTDPWTGWCEAWQHALYGPGGFYRRLEGPAGHFRTATHAAGDVLAGALVRLARERGCSALVDVGAGRGELLTAVHGLARDLVTRDLVTGDLVTGDLITGESAAGGLRLHGVDVVARPDDLPASIDWSPGLAALPPGALAGALVVAWELLDTVPCVVVEADEGGVPRELEVDRATGDERFGGVLAGPASAWAATWWPVAGRPGARAEIGAARDELWGQLVRRAGADGGGAVLLAVDYAHAADDRPDGGSLAGYRDGRLVAAVPDGSCDVTAHVAMDAVADAGEAAGARTTRLTTQRDALRALGVSGRLASGELVTAAALARMSREAELIDSGGLGGFAWLEQSVPARS